MAMSPAGLFATDMDGTLLLPGSDFHPEDLLALEALGEMGVIRVIATGRSPFSFARMMGNRVLPVDYLVLSSGAGIMDYHSGSFIRTSSMDPRRTAELVEWLMERDMDFCVQSTIPDNHVFTYCYSTGNNPDLERRIELYRGHCSPREGEGSADGSTQVVVIIPPWKAGNDPMREFMHLRDMYSVVRTTSPLDGESIWVEIFPPEISKGKAVEWLAARHGLTGEDAAAVGNDYNDHDLLAWAAHAYVVEDSPEHLRTSFVEVSSVRMGAVAHAARLWLRKRGQLTDAESWPAP